jgi:hypothetical protein
VARLRRVRPALVAATVVATACGCSTTAPATADAAGAWSVLNNTNGDVSPSAQAVIVNDDNLLLLGGTGGTPDDHRVRAGVAVDLRTGATRQLAAPPFEGSLGLSVAAVAAGTVVVVGSPCLSNRAYSTGDCEPTPFVAATYSVKRDRWTQIEAPPVPDAAVLDTAGAVGSSAVFTVRGTGEAFGWDVTSSRWTRISGQLAPSGVTTCVSDVGPVAVTTSYVVDGATVSASPTPTIEDGVEVSGPDPASTSPIVHVLTDSGWSTRAQVAATSLFEFELACGGDTAFLLSQELDAPAEGPPPLTLNRIDLASGTVSAVPADPRFRYGAWQAHAVSSDVLLALDGSHVEQALAYDAAQQRWTSVPPSPAALAPSFRVLAATATDVVVRGILDSGEGRIAVLHVDAL